MDIQVNRTYAQNWKAYNAAQTSEKTLFQKLLFDLCRDLERAPQKKNGRPSLPLQDIVFAICFKIYSTVSARRFMADLRDAREKGYITRTPHFNSIFNYLEAPEMTEILQTLITKTSLPLKEIESDFAVDSSGFMTSRFERWIDKKYGTEKKQHEWVKAHIICGVKTHIVTAVEIHDKNTSDTIMLPALVDSTAKNFHINEVSADKIYGRISNYEAIAKHGATPFIIFKSHHTPRLGGLWAKMYHYFQYRRDDFLSHYHKRSNVETAFSMIKGKFRDHVRSKTDRAMANEVRAKIVAHNICVLIQEMFELGIDVDFAQKPLYN